MGRERDLPGSSVRSTWPFPPVHVSEGRGRFVEERKTQSWHERWHRFGSMSRIRLSPGGTKDVSRSSFDAEAPSPREAEGGMRDEEDRRCAGTEGEHGRVHFVARQKNRKSLNLSNRLGIVSSSQDASRGRQTGPESESNVTKEVDGLERLCVLTKPIFILSDCTGESAARSCMAALTQLDLCEDLSCPTNLAIYRFLNEEADIYEIVKKAAEIDALVVYTLVNKRMKEAVESACEMYNVKRVDMWSNLLEEMEQHLEKKRVGVPFGRRRTAPRKLSSDYFRMIEAVEFTRKHDDGSMPETWKDADILLLGVSRTGKTPLSIYLGQRGFKVANLPLVLGMQPPKQLWEIDPSKVFVLNVDPSTLQHLRTRRLSNLGLETNTSYDDLRRIKAELIEARQLCARNPGWSVLDVTNSSIEESAASIMHTLAEREGAPQNSPHLYHSPSSILN